MALFTGDNERRRIDGRWIIAAALLGCLALLAALIHSSNYYQAWSHLGVQGVKPFFADLRVITAGGDSYRAGFDPLVYNPRDPWDRPMDYPRLWLLPQMAFGIHQSDTVALGLGVVAIFWVCLFLFVGRIGIGQGLWWGALLCAPPVMLAVERANNDLIIFSLLALALVALRRDAARPWFAYLVVGLCAVLKLYPVCAFMLAGRETPRRGATVLAVAAIAFAVYLGAIHDDLQSIDAAVPRMYGVSYGSHVCFDRLSLHVPPDGLPGYCPALAVLAVFLLTCLGRVRLPDPLPLRPAEADGLRVGGALYVATFVASNNFNYRLIMLLFAVPALFQLLEGTVVFYRRLSLVLLASLMVGWWLSARRSMELFVLKEAANWIVFAGMLFLLLQLLPPFHEWAKEVSKLPLNKRRGVASIPSVSAPSLL